MLLRILRFVAGTVEFLISGAFPEKLLTKAVSKRIPIWGVRHDEEGLYASSYAKNYKPLAREARKNGLKTKINRKNGLPFLRFRYRKRWGLPAGVLLSVAIVWYLVSHIWIITVKGCEAIPETTMLEYLEQCGLKSGMKRRDIDTSKIEKELLLLEDGLSWVTINIDGAAAEVIIGESVKAPEVIDPKDKYANVVASCDGIIRRIELYDGQPLLKAGDTVSKGEVIISGITDDQYKNTMLRYARGKVIAEVCIETEITVPMKESVIEEEETPVFEKEVYIMGKKIPFGNKGTAQRSMRLEKSEWTLLYPFLLVRENRCFLPKRKEIIRTAFEAKEEAVKQLRDLMSAERGIECVLREETEIIETKDSITLKAISYVEKDIATTVEFLAY